MLVNHSTYILLSVGIISLSVWNSHSEEPSKITNINHVKIPNTNFILPTKIEKLRYLRLKKYQHPALGTGITYVGIDIVASIYVYNMGYKFIPKGPNSQIVQRGFKQSVQDIYTVDRRMGRKSIPNTGKIIIDIKSNNVNSLKYIYQSFRVLKISKNSVSLKYSEIYMTSFENNIIKVRITFRKKSAQLEKSQSRKFITNLTKAIIGNSASREKR